MKLTGTILGSAVFGVVIANTKVKNLVAGLKSSPDLSEAHLAHLEDALTESYGKVSEEEGKSTGLFDDLSNMINQTMSPAILTAHESAQEQLNGFLEAFSHCLEPEAFSKSGSDGAANPQIEAKLEEHRTCRANQAKAIVSQDECHDALEQAQTVATSICNSVPGAQGQPPALDASSHVGCKVTPGDYKGWVASFSSQIDQLKRQFDSAKEGCGNATNIVSDKEPKCLAANQTAAGNKSACDAIQLAADTMGCSSEVQAAQTCKLYDVCYEAAKSNYMAQNESIAAAQLNRTVQWRTLKRMQCLLREEEAGASHKGIDACKNATVDTSHLDLAYPALPPKTPCADLSETRHGPKPCSPEWVLQYGSLPPTAPAASCTPCVTTTTTTWVLLFRQTVPKVWKKNELSLNADDPSNDNYAILNQLESFRVYGKFEFKLRWIQRNGEPLKEQWWRQASNPVTMTTRGVVGYDPMSAPYKGNAWGGLENNLGKGALIDGSVGKEWWWYAVGCYQLSGGSVDGFGYPGVSTGSSSILVKQVELSVAFAHYQGGDASWPLVFRQVMPYKWKKDQWSLNPGQPTSENFAILDQLEKYRSTDGKFEFKLVWPMGIPRNFHGQSWPREAWTQVWRQSSNPVTMTSRGVLGYEVVPPADCYRGSPIFKGSPCVQYSGAQWGGLENNMGQGGAMLDGSVGTNHWWFAVGAWKWHNAIPIVSARIPNTPAEPGIPGPVSNNPNVGMVPAVELYVKHTPPVPPVASCHCKTPGAGAAEHNEYTCTDGTTGYCAASEECYSTNGFSKGSFADGCATFCQCTTPGQGTAGFNQFTCGDGSTSFCQADQECFRPGKFSRQLGGCRVPR